jgi:chemotaxis protein CheX
VVFLSTVYIAPFIKGTAIVLTDMLGLTVTRGEPEVEGDLFKSYGFTAIVGFTGGWRGRFLLDMSPTTAVALARGFTGEEYQSEKEEEVLLCGAELANIISGQAITYINNSQPGMNIRLTPPSVFTGEGLSMFNIHLNSSSIVIQTEAGPVKINAAVEESGE